MQKNINIRDFEMEKDFDWIFLLDSYVNVTRSRKEVQEEIQNYSGDIYVATINKKVIGFISLSYPFWDKVAMIDYLAVEENYRKQGIGRLLIHHVLKRAQELSMRYVCVQTGLWNLGAINFYKRVGFSLRGVFPEYEGEGNDMIWLDIDIRKNSEASKQKPITYKKV